MARTSVSSEAKDLVKRPVLIERGWEDRFNLVVKELTPDQVRLRLQMAEMGNLGPLQMIYQMMETDARYAGIVSHLKSSVALCPVKTFQSEKKGRASNLAFKIVKEQFSRINKVRLIKQLCAPYIRGIWAWEKRWELEGSAYTENDLAFFKGLKSISGARYLMDMDHQSENFGQLMISSEKYPEGRPVTDYPEGGILWSDDGDIEEGFYDMGGAARRCLGWWMTKVYTQTFWAHFNETWGEPVRAAFVPNEKKDKERKEVERFLRFLGRNLYGIFDEDIELNILDVNKTGTVLTYENMIKMANEEMSMALTGQPGSTNAKREGSYAREAVHFRVVRSIVSMIVAMITEMLTQIVDDICRFNISTDFDPEDRPIVKPVVPRAEEKDTLARMYATATKLIDVPVRQIREDLEIEEPKDGEETVGPQSRNQVDQSRGSEESDSSESRSSEDRLPNSTGEQEPDR